MTAPAEQSPAEFIVPLNMNGLAGRMLAMPSSRRKKREILFVYGHHSTIERWYTVAEELRKYGTVTIPDLPGFGGMDSFYKIGQRPTLDALADYLAAFIKLRYKRRRVTIVGLSFGFVIVTRMLQRYPDIAKRVDLLVSIVGFSHRDDFTFTKSRYLFYRVGAAFFSWRLPAWLYRYVILQPAILRRIYYKSFNAADKFKGLEAEEFQATMEMEIDLWHRNDVRTHMATNIQMLKVDNCQAQIDLPVWHVYMQQDRYFDPQLVEQHLRVIYSNVLMAQSKLEAHAPSVIADSKTVAKLIPPQLKRELQRS